jgi:hypothetical protein
MTTLDRLDRWKASGVISADQHVLLRSLVRQDRFSLFVETSALLYIGVLSVVGGLVWTFRDYVANLGDAVILSILGLLMAVSFYYCFSRGVPYDNDEVESPSMIFDYVLYFGCLVLSATLGFIETRFAIFQTWTTHLFIASVVFGLLAYRFDNRFVLSLAISTLAGYLGLTIDAFDLADTDILRFTALAFGTVLGGLGVWLHRQGIKPHFLETYIHIGANVIMMATASGVLEPSTGWLYLAALLALSVAAIYLGVRFDRFAFVAYGTLYGYGGVSAKLLASIGSPIAALWYFLVTGTIIVIGLMVLARRFGRDD